MKNISLSESLFIFRQETMYQLKKYPDMNFDEKIDQSIQNNVFFSKQFYLKPVSTLFLEKIKMVNEKVHLDV